MKLIDTMNFLDFYNKIKSQKMSIKLAYKLSKIAKKCKEDEGFYQEKLRELLLQYAELDEQGNFIPVDDGKGIKMKPECQTACLAAIDELQNTESSLIFEPLTIDELQSLEVAPTDIESIIDFLE